LLLATCESPRIISRHTKRNKKWALKKFGEFLPVPSDEDLTSFLSFFSVLQRRSFSHLGRLEVAWNPATMDHHLRGEMMISAFLYARVSSREQEQEGFSIPAQLKLLRDYAVRNGLIIQEEFIDVETAKVAGRKQFDRMVQSLSRNKHCRTVLVEKTDRLYRNFRDAVTLEDLDVEVHLVKEGQIISKDARSQAKLIHGMQLVLARNYVENLREEVKKGMREKAEQGIYPGRAPYGYRNNKADRTIEVHPKMLPLQNGYSSFMPPDSIHSWNFAPPSESKLARRSSRAI
jgi:DNA invertase Pin-like site-specific DNA recombinase